MWYLLGFILLLGLCKVGFYVSGALLSMLIWLLFKLPLAMILAAIGILCCFTLIFIPIGIACFKGAIAILT